MTHTCVSKLTIICSDNGLSPDLHQAIIWTNAKILLIGPLGTNFSEILIEILTFSFKKMPLKVLSAKWWPFCLGLNVLLNYVIVSQENNSYTLLRNNILVLFLFVFSQCTRTQKMNGKPVWYCEEYTWLWEWEICRNKITMKFITSVSLGFPRYKITSLSPSDEFMCEQTGSSLVQVMACHQFGNKTVTMTVFQFQYAISMMDENI